MTVSRLGRLLAIQEAMKTPASNECDRVQEGSDAAQGTVPGSQLSPDPILEPAPQLVTAEEEISELVTLLDSDPTVPCDQW